MPFCNVKGHLLMCKRACFAMQKGVFYKPLCNLLILRRLQSRFLMIMSWFANKNTLRFVRVFQKPEQKPNRSLSPTLSEGRGRIISEIPRCVWEEGVRKKQASPRPSPKGEGEQLARFPRYVWEDIKRCLRVLGLVLKKKNRQIACFKLRIYELTDRRIAGL